jgi:glycosyltransferase involved in cell wall biosynthesis
MALDPGRSISPPIPVLEAPRVSIGMPVYNGEPHLRKALDSLLAQTFLDYELIISDNASTDRTSEICREYASKDARIRYIQQKENKGAAWNFNFVLEQALAEYFMWAACDDLWSPDCLSEYVKVLNGDESVTLVFCCFGVYNHVLKNIENNYVLPSMLDNKVNNLILRFLNPVPNMIYGLFRKSFILSTTVTIDIDFWDLLVTHVTAAKGKIYIHSDPLFYTGIKTDMRKIYSHVKGSKIRYHQFFFRNLKLIITTFKFFKGFALLILFCFFYIKLVSNTERQIRNQNRGIET